MSYCLSQVQERLGDKVWLSHRAVGVRREGAVWVTTLETPLGVKVQGGALVGDVVAVLGKCHGEKLVC